jgi:hypothetical protein
VEVEQCAGAPDGLVVRMRRDVDDGGRHEWGG